MKFKQLLKFFYFLGSIDNLKESLFMIFLAFPFGSTVVFGQGTQVPLHGVYEITLTSNGSGSYINGPTVSAILTAPDGSTQTIRGFWDGDNKFKIRFRPDKEGTWTYITSSSDGGLNNNEGSFQCSGRLPQDHASFHGHVINNPSRPYTFMHTDGTPFFFMGDTQWSFSTNAISWPDEFQMYIDARADQGFNYIHGVVYQLWPEGNDSNEGGQAFLGNDVNQLNPGFWQAFDQRVEYMNEKGIVVGFLLGWANEAWAQNFFSEDQVERYAQYAIDRYGAYNVIWIIEGEYEEASPPGGHNNLGNYFKENDPYNHPRTIHTIDTSADDFGSEAWHTVIYQQLSDEIERISSDRIYNKPVVNAEFGYEGSDNSSDEIRVEAWEIVMRGGFFVYGKRNTFHFDANMNHSSLYSEGALYLSHLYDFFTEQTGWWDLDPNHSLSSGSGVFTLARPGSEYVIYLRDGGSTSVDLSAVSDSLDVEWFNPRNGSLTSAGSVTGATFDFTAPDGNDWVLHIGGFSTDSTPPTPPQNLTAVATSDTQIDLNWQVANDPESGISRYNIYRNGTNIVQSIMTLFTDTNLNENTEYIYEVSAVNGAGLESARSSPVSTTTFPDITPPAIITVSAVSATEVNIVFSEHLEKSSAENVSNYRIDPGITITNAILMDDKKTVRLTTNEHEEGVSYTLTVNNIRDASSVGNPIDANSSESYVYVKELRITNWTPPKYQIARLGAGDQYYIDRSYSISNLPSEFEGFLWIKTANDDKLNGGENFITFEANKSVAVFVAFDTRASVPIWLSDWTNTGKSVETTDVPLKIYGKDFLAGEIALGGNNGAPSMYVVLIKTDGGHTDSAPPKPPTGIRVNTGG